MSSPNSSSRLAQLRKRLLNSVGPRAVHAAEDGLTVGLTLGFVLSYPPLAALLAAAVTGLPKRAGPMAILRELGGIVRSEDARAQESYFAVALTAGVLVGLGVGTVVEAAALAAGVEIPVEAVLGR
jgi:hypothetical protein